VEVERQNGLLLDKLSKIASRKANTSSNRALQPGEAPPPDRCVALRLEREREGESERERERLCWSARWDVGVTAGLRRATQGAEPERQWA
jgi:hypothetical protein